VTPSVFSITQRAGPKFIAALAIRGTLLASQADVR
jgi:hypothetical protein